MDQSNETSQGRSSLILNGRGSLVPHSPSFQGSAAALIRKRRSSSGYAGHDGGSVS